MAKRLTEKDFWERVNKTETCWVYTGPINAGGYGIFAGERAHRYSWRLHYGDIPDGLCVCHHCDNRPCIRPEHFFLGTQADNMHDLYVKNLKTQQHPKILSALNWLRARRQIRGEQTRLARQLDISLPFLSDIIRGNRNMSAKLLDRVTAQAAAEEGRK